MTTRLEKLDDLMHEKEVYERWKGRFAEDELKEARQSGRIEWFDLRKGPHYTEAQLLDYLETRKRVCQRARPLNPEQEQPEESQPNGSNSKGNGSDKKRRGGISIVTGTSGKGNAVLSAVEALGQNL
jgi:hypothetical protein